MSNQCNQCGSYAINHHHHGRDGSDPDLCDVCYWHTRHDQLQAELAALKAKAAVPEIVPQWGKSLSHCWPKCEASKEGDWCVGHISEDGDFYDVLTVEASQYDADGESQKIAEAIVALWAFAEAAPSSPAAPEVKP